MAYSELIKNFDSVREYLRDFFVYGFRSREDYADRKSLRSYDNEKRRIESYLGDYVSFRSEKDGKCVFISMESKKITHNPLHKAFKAKSFTDKDITLHFIMMDILADGEKHSLSEIADTISNEYLAEFENPMSFDESTLRKKLNEYIELGFVTSEKAGKTSVYSLRGNSVDIEESADAIRFFTEENIVGVVGSFIEDKMNPEDGIYTFKNHYLMNAYNAAVIEQFLEAIHGKCKVSFTNISRENVESEWQIVPLKIYSSATGGRQYLIGSTLKGKMMSFRIDYIKNVIVNEPYEDYDAAMTRYETVRKRVWGVNISPQGETNHIEMDIRATRDEQYIVERLNREKRCGTVEKIDDNLYRYSADVFDANELMPWIRTFIGRITYKKKGYLEGKPDYADGFDENNRYIFYWDSKIGQGINGAYMRTVESAKTRRLFVQKDDDEGSDFYFVGKVDVLSKREDVKEDKKGKKQKITKVVFKLNSPIRNDLFEYFEAGM